MKKSDFVMCEKLQGQIKFECAGWCEITDKGNFTDNQPPFERSIRKQRGRRIIISLARDTCQCHRLAQNKVM